MPSDSSLFTKARKYIDMSHVKKLREEEIQVEKEKKKLYEEYLEGLRDNNHHRFSDWRFELDEGMTCSAVMAGTTFPAVGEVDLSDLPANDESTYSTEVNGEPADAFGGGVAIKDSGTGTGNNGGFNIGQSYLAFDGEGIPGTEGLRVAFLDMIDTSKFDTMVLTAIRGNDSNGGEDPDAEGEELRLYYDTSWSGSGPYQSITKNDKGEDIPGQTDVIIPLGNDTANLRSWVIHLPAHVRNEKTFFAFYQNKSSSTGFDNYGITQVRFQRRAPVTVFVSLDDPQASAFVRTDPAFAGLTQEQKLKKLKKMLEDSDEYVKKIFGKDFPGTGAAAPGSVNLGSEEPSIQVTNYPQGPTEDQDPSERSFYDLYKDELEKSGKKPGERGATPYTQWLKTQTDKYIDPAEPDPNDPENKPYDQLTDDEKAERLKEINRRTRKANDPYYHTPDVDNLPKVVETVDGRRQAVSKIPPIPGNTGARTAYFNEHHTEAFDKDAALKYQERNWQSVGAWRSWLNDWDYSSRYTEIGGKLSGLRIVPNSPDQSKILRTGDDYADAIDSVIGAKSMIDHIKKIYSYHIDSAPNEDYRRAYIERRDQSLAEQEKVIKDREKKLATQRSTFDDLLNSIREKTDEIRDPFVNGGNIIEYIDTYVDDFPDEVNQLIKQGVDQNFKGLQDMFAQPDLRNQILDSLMENPLFRYGSKLVQSLAPTSAKVFVDYLTGSLPSLINNEYLGQKYVDSVLKKVSLKKNGTIQASTVSEPDLIIGTGGLPKYDASTGEVILPFNYDFQSNEKELNAASPGKNILYSVLTARTIPTLSGFRSFYGMFGGTEDYTIDSLPIPFAAYFIEKAKKQGGASATKGEVRLNLTDIKNENPKFYEALRDRTGLNLPDLDPEEPKAEPKEPKDRRSQEAERRRKQKEKREKEKKELGSVGEIGDVDASDAASAAAAAAERRRKRRGTGIKESAQKKRLKSPTEIMKKIPGYYDGKPAPLGFPIEKPPEMINGLHPDLVDGKKVSQRFNKLDPISAKAMPPTGNPHIDKKVQQAKKKPK